MQAQTNGRTVQSVVRSFDIVDALIELKGARVGEIATHLGISESAVSNHLYTLQEAGYVTFRGDGYYPSLKFVYVGELAKRRDAAYETAIEVTNELSDRTPFGTSFLVEENGLGRYLTPEVDRPSEYDRFALAGQQEYLHSVASGKAILAAYPRKRVEKILDHWGLPAKTPQTITSRERLFADLETVRERGYAINHEENQEGIHVLGMAVHKPNGTVLGAMSLGGQTTRIREEEFNDRIRNLLSEHVETLEDRLG